MVLYVSLNSPIRLFFLGLTIQAWENISVRNRKKERKKERTNERKKEGKKERKGNIQKEKKLTKKI